MLPSLFLCNLASRLSVFLFVSPDLLICSRNDSCNCIANAIKMMACLRGDANWDLFPLSYRKRTILRVDTYINQRHCIRMGTCKWVFR